MHTGTVLPAGSSVTLFKILLLSKICIVKQVLSVIYYGLLHSEKRDYGCVFPEVCMAFFFLDSTFKQP